MGIPLYALSKDVNVGLHSNRLLPSTMLLQSVFHGPMLLKFRYQPKHSASAQSCVGWVVPPEPAYCEVGIFSTLIVEPYYCSSLLYCPSMGSCCLRHSSQSCAHKGAAPFLDNLIGLQMLHSIGQLSLLFYWATTPAFLSLNFYWLTIPAFLLVLLLLFSNYHRACKVIL